MIADVSGFTALTEALGGQGSAGVELLTKCMNRYFTQVCVDRMRLVCVCEQFGRGGAARAHKRAAERRLGRWGPGFLLTGAQPHCVALLPRSPPPSHLPPLLLLYCLSCRQVIDLLLLYGGDVEKFAGDCMIVVFAPTWEEAQGAWAGKQLAGGEGGSGRHGEDYCGMDGSCWARGYLVQAQPELSTAGTAAGCLHPGSDDGGLAAATLRAVTCGSQLATRFGELSVGSLGCSAAGTAACLTALWSSGHSLHGMGGCMQAAYKMRAA